jgi:N-methylhydantoinase B
VTIDPGGPAERVLPGLCDGEAVAAGEVIRIETTGGGGWGDPLAREPWRVALDVRQGKVSPEAATRDYGVVLAADVADVAFSSRERPLERPNPRRERGGPVQGPRGAGGSPGAEVDEAATAALRARLAAERGEPAMFDRGSGYPRLAGGATGAAVDRVTGS